MIYNQPLPKIDKLQRLSKSVGPFPLTARHITLAARRFGYSPNTVTFLKLFPSDEFFESRADFVTRCSELELLIDQERKSEQETLRSPQE